MQAGLGNERRVHALAGQGRSAANLAGRHLGVLRLNGHADVQRRELVIVKLVGIQPDAHRVLGAEQLHVADPGNAADLILNRRGDVVAQIGPAQAPVRRNESDGRRKVLY